MLGLEHVLSFVWSRLVPGIFHFAGTRAHLLTHSLHAQPMGYVEPNPTYHVNETNTAAASRFDQTLYLDAATDLTLPPLHLYAVDNRGGEMFFGGEIKNAGAGGSSPAPLTVNPNGAALLLVPDQWHVASINFYTGSAYVPVLSPNMSVCVCAFSFPLFLCPYARCLPVLDACSSAHVHDALVVFSK